MSEPIAGRSVSLEGLRIETSGQSGVMIEMLDADHAEPGKELPVLRAHLISWELWAAIVAVVGEKDGLA